MTRGTVRRARSARTVRGLLLLVLGPVAAVAVANAQQPAVLELSAAQIERLGIEWFRPEGLGGRVVMNAPAVAAVPPTRETVVSAPVGGLVTTLFIAEGSEVEAGDPLVGLRSLELLAAQREYVDAASGARLAEAQLARDRMLHEEGIIARRRLDEAEAAALAARVRAEQTGQQLRLVGTDDAALERLASSGEISPELTLRAPVAGVVIGRHGAVGEQVDALEPIVRIADLRELWLEARVPQERANGMTVGMRLVADLRGETIEGEIVHVGRTVDMGTQTVLVRAVVNNESYALRAGQVVDVRVVAASGPDALTLPMSAVTRIDGQAFVFARVPSGLRAVPVSIVGEGQGRVQVEAEGLDASASVAVRGVSAIKSLLTADEE